MRPTGDYRGVTWIVVIALALLLPGCGTGSAPNPTSPPTTVAAPATTITAAPTTAPPPVCADVAGLRTALEELAKIRPAQDSVTTLNAAIVNVKTSLDAAEASASTGVLAPEIQQAKTAFGQLQAAASGLTSDNARQKAPAIGSALLQVNAATRALSDALNENCPGS